VALAHLELDGSLVATSILKRKRKEPFLQFPGTDVMIFKIFSPKNSAKKLAFLNQNKAKF
jgi:hypothetical protein